MSSNVATTRSASPHAIPVVGIIGGIGSGKSAIARWVAEHAKVEVLDADEMGHQALEAPEVKNALCIRFGDAILGADGKIARSALAREVFGPESHHRQARQDLERIMHPEIGRRIENGIATAVAQSRDVVLLDAAVLMEAGWRPKVDMVVFVDTPEADRLARVRDGRGWTENEYRKREASQWSLADKRKESDFIIPNDCSIESSGQQLLDLLRTRGLITEQVPG
jgi:dephospho-CoA kinase